MLDVPMIQTRGFHNREGGFDLRVRLPYYRGLWTSLIEGATVSVDGERHAADTVRWTIGDGTSPWRSSPPHQRSMAGGRPCDVARVPDGTLAIGSARRGGRAAGTDVLHPGRAATDHLERGAQAGDHAMTNGGYAYGVSLYSYTSEFGSTLTLDDCIEDVADVGATGLEILGEAHVEGYPDPSTAWVDAWFARLDRLSLTPTCLGSWVDTRRFGPAA